MRRWAGGGASSAWQLLCTVPRCGRGNLIAWVSSQPKALLHPPPLPPLQMAAQARQVLAACEKQPTDAEQVRSWVSKSRRCFSRCRVAGAALPHACALHTALRHSQPASMAQLASTSHATVLTVTPLSLHLMPSAPVLTTPRSSTMMHATPSTSAPSLSLPSTAATRWD